MELRFGQLLEAWTVVQLDTLMVLKYRFPVTYTMRNTLLDHLYQIHPELREQAMLGLK